jgi:hypothetical chaperone protein
MAPVALDWIEPALASGVSPEGLAQHLTAPLAQVVQCAQQCLQLAGLQAGDLQAIYLTGGSSALRPLRHALRVAFPDTAQVEGDLFGGVALGLAVAP